MAIVSDISHQLTFSVVFKIHKHAEQNQIKQLTSVNDSCTPCRNGREDQSANKNTQQYCMLCCTTSITVTYFHNATVCSDVEKTQQDSSCTEDCTLTAKHTGAAFDTIQSQMVRHAGGAFYFSFPQTFALEVELGLVLPLLHQPAHASKCSHRGAKHRAMVFIKLSSFPVKCCYKLHTQKP